MKNKNKTREPDDAFYKIFKFFYHVFIEKTEKGHRIIKIKEWTDKNGRTHLDTVSNWVGNPFVSIGMPIIIVAFIGLTWLFVNPILFPFIAIILIVGLVVFFISTAIFTYKFNNIWTEENGWVITSLPEPADGIKRLCSNKEYRGFKMIREIDESSDTHRWYAHNVWTGEHFEWPEKTKGKDFSIKQMNQITNWLKEQIDDHVNERKR